jgi:hypothetical protein
MDPDVLGTATSLFQCLCAILSSMKLHPGNQNLVLVQLSPSLPLTHRSFIPFSGTLLLLSLISYRAELNRNLTTSNMFMNTALILKMRDYYIFIAIEHNSIH